MATKKVEPVLNQPPQCVKSKRVVSAPKSCPYENYFIEIEFTNGLKQVMTQKTPNENSFGNHEFNNKEDLLKYYDSL